MLKIKDNVDLKELEKFGFYENNTKTAYYYHLDERFDNYDDKYEIKWELSVYCKDRSLRLFNEIRVDKQFHTAYSLDHLDIIMRLIQAGYVEKVEE